MQRAYKKTSAPRLWRQPDLQFTAALNDPWYQQISNLYSTFFFASVEFFHSKNFVPALVPITTNSISSPMGLGSDSEPVKISLHERPTYLADSMQFSLEYYLRQGHKGAFYIMPSFRGEDSDCRHLNQFYHSEAEIVGGLADVMVLIEDYVAQLCTSILQCGSGVNSDRLEGHLANHRPPRISVEDAVADFRGDERYVRKLGNTDEWVITAAGELEILSRNKSEAVWLMHPSRTSTPFYQAVNPNQTGSVLAADLLLGIGETVGCGERHTTAEDVAASLDLHDVSAAQYEWYLRLKREYPMRTAGFGLGMERFLLWVLGHDDIRDIHPVPRLKEEPWSL